MKALVVDDSRAMRNIVKKIVNSIGFETDEAENGQVALDAINSFPDYDVVLLDWNMPVMNGLEFVVEARKAPQHENLKIVMVTTESEPEKMVRALMAGVDEFVMKPFTKDVLLEKLNLIGVGT